MSGALAGMAGWPVPSAAGAVVGPDGALATFGDVHRPFSLASVTKPLAALSALVAVEEGAIGLDDAVWVTDLVPGATLRHLFAHAAGLAPDRLLRVAAPGQRRIYSNVGIDLLAETMAVATGIDFESYFAQSVAAPLGLSATTVGRHPSRDGVSTVADLVRVLAELLGGDHLLHPSTQDEATTVQFPGLRGILPGFGAQADNAWGLGLEIKATKSPHWTGALNSAATYGHFGQSGTMLWIDPAASLGVVALTDQPFGDWARAAWPALSDAVLTEWGSAG